MLTSNLLPGNRLANVVYLTRAQRERQLNIRLGVVTRSQVEIVMSRYQEDIAWSDMYASLRTVYDKAPLRRLARAQKQHGIHRQHRSREPRVPQAHC